MSDTLTDADLEVRAEAELRAKYTDAQVEALGKEGKAFKNPDGHFSFPIDDAADLSNAVQALGRAPEAVRDAVKAYIVKRAGELKLTASLPEDWRSADEDTESREMKPGMKACPTCEGAGTIRDGSTECPDCEGTGEVEGGEQNSADDETEIRTAAWAAKERRKARAALVDGMPERRFWQEAWGSVGLELRERPEGIVQVGGYASVTECWYEVGDYEERAVRGFCRRTLGEKPDLMFLANHADMPMGRTKNGSLRLEEPHRGLRYDVDLQLHDPDVKRLLPKLEREDMDESSFAFRARDQEWDADYRKRSLIDVSLHKGDVSVVNYGANPAASAGLRAFEDLGLEHLGEAMIEARAGKAISSKNATEIKAAIEKLKGLLPQAEPELEPVADPLAILIPSGVESDRARRAQAIARAA
jgi:HK97 family phage prohead protease